MTAIDKQPRHDPVMIGPLGLEGDEQAEAVIHGGPDRAVLQYALHHYDAWRAEFPEIAEKFVPGGFGENIVAGGLDEETVCIGDLVRIGGVLLRVTQSRAPCFKLNHRFGRAFVARRAQETFRTGWFYAVAEPGHAKVGDVIEILARPHPQWPVSRVQHYLYREPGNLDAARELAELPALSTGMQALFAKRAALRQVEAWEDRLWNRPPVAADEPDWFDLEVDAVWDVTPFVKAFRLRAAPGVVLPGFDPGAHIEVRVPDGTVRHYSLCNLDSDGFYEIAVSPTPGRDGGSRFLYNHAVQGMKLTVSRPRNSFPAMLGAKTHLLIAGGIGVTPFLSMIRGFEQSGDQYRLHLCAKSRELAPFIETLCDLANGTVALYCRNGNPVAGLQVEEVLREVDTGTHVYCCGPAGLMDAVHRATRHWPARNIHFESFGSRLAKGTDDCSAFRVKLASSGRILEVPADRTILETLREAGVAVPSSCEAGTCGTCKTGYLEGIVDHRDYFLSRDEATRFLTICVSRAASEGLTLDL